MSQQVVELIKFEFLCPVPLAGDVMAFALRNGLPDLHTELVTKKVTGELKMLPAPRTDTRYGRGKAVQATFEFVSRVEPGEKFLLVDLRKYVLAHGISKNAMYEPLTRLRKRGLVKGKGRGLYYRTEKEWPVEKETE
jgi:hypothetical protein